MKMATIYLRRTDRCAGVWWTKFYHPLTSACLRVSLGTANKEEAQRYAWLKDTGAISASAAGILHCESRVFRERRDSSFVQGRCHHVPTFRSKIAGSNFRETGVSKPSGLFFHVAAAAGFSGGAQGGRMVIRNLAKFFRNHLRSGKLFPKRLSHIPFSGRSRRRSNRHLHPRNSKDFPLTARAVGHGEHVIDWGQTDWFLGSKNQARIPIMHIRVRNEFPEIPSGCELGSICGCEPSIFEKQDGDVRPRDTNSIQNRRQHRPQGNEWHPPAAWSAVKTFHLEKASRTGINNIAVCNGKAIFGQNSACDVFSKKQISPPSPHGPSHRRRKFDHEVSDTI